MIYLDWAATAAPDPVILETMFEKAAHLYGNPSSVHGMGRAAKETLEEARKRCSSVLGCSPEQLIFTSGASEANNMLIFSRLRRERVGGILISGIEHPSVTEPAGLLAKMGGSLKVLNPQDDGRVSPEGLAAAVDGETRLVAVMGVNNEIGVIEPLNELAAALRGRENPRRPIHFHVDMVQMAGRKGFRLDELDVDSASFSAHKIRGPRGVGLLYLRRGNIETLYRGGGQEYGLRPGTENPAGALGMAMALERHGRPNPVTKKTGELLIEGLRNIPGCRMVPEARLVSPKHYVPEILAAAFPPVPGEVLTRVLDERGFAVSTGSACKKGKKESTVMRALGLPKDTANSFIRISIGSLTSAEDIASFIEALNLCLAELSAVGKRP